MGPARTGKTQGLLDCWAAHIIVNDPRDAMFVHMSQDMAADYSKRRIDRLQLESPEFRGEIAGATHRYRSIVD